jgi:hypothetical protein
MARVEGRGFKFKLKCRCKWGGWARVSGWGGLTMG